MSDSSKSWERLKEPGKSPQSKSYMWVRVSGPPTNKIILYDYASSRSGKIAEDLLADYQGYLQTDDYAGYHALGNMPDITHLGFRVCAPKVY